MKGVCSMASIFRNEKIKNGLKFFFSRKGNGEAFSFVQSIPFFVQNVGFFYFCIWKFFTGGMFFSSYHTFLYKTKFRTIDVVFSTFKNMFLTIASSIHTNAQIICTMVILRC